MICEKCGNQINDGDTFCSKCGNKIEDIINKQDNESNSKRKLNKPNKKIIYTMIGTIIIVIVAIVGIIILGTNKNKDTINNENISIEENSNSNSEIQDFKYVQKDDNSPVGYSFTNIDFELFKDNVRRVWFKEALEFDSIMEVNKSKFGNNYSKWVEGHTQDNYPSEEIVTYYTTTGTINGPYSISKSVVILYNLPCLTTKPEESPIFPNSKKSLVSSASTKVVPIPILSGFSLVYLYNKTLASLTISLIKLIASSLLPTLLVSIKRLPIFPIAIEEAISPPLWPPIPSATAIKISPDLFLTIVTLSSL